MSVKDESAMKSCLEHSNENFDYPESVSPSVFNFRGVVSMEELYPEKNIDCLRTSDGWNIVPLELKTYGQKPDSLSNFPNTQSFEDNYQTIHEESHLVMKHKPISEKTKVKKSNKKTKRVVEGKVVRSKSLVLSSESLIHEAQLLGKKKLKRHAKRILRMWDDSSPNHWNVFKRASRRSSLCESQNVLQYEVIIESDFSSKKI